MHVGDAAGLVENSGRILEGFPCKGETCLGSSPGTPTLAHPRCCSNPAEISGGLKSGESMCECGTVHDTGWCMFAVVSQRLRHPGLLPGGGGQVTLHFSAVLNIVGVAPRAGSLCPSQPGPSFPRPLESASLLFPFLDPVSLVARKPRLLLLGGCCLIGPNPLILKVRKLSPKEGQGLVQVAQ